MRKTIFTLILVPFLTVLTLGCGPSRPDPRENPDFNEDALNDPDAIQMDTL